MEIAPAGALPEKSTPMKKRFGGFTTRIYAAAVTTRAGGVDPLAPQVGMVGERFPG